MDSEPLELETSDGVQLEAVIDSPDDVRAGLVFCHPHPNFGGTMNAPLLLALRDALIERSWAVIRFNFRGVGASTGKSSLGEAEVADATAALDALTARIDAPIAIAGWSFGGAVAVRTAALHRDRISACAAIAPAVQYKEGITAGLPVPGELGPLPPLLIVLGANDEHIAADAVESWVRDLDDARVVTIPGANHFFWARYDELATTVCDWLDETTKTGVD